MSMNCKNPRCKEALNSQSRYFCRSCRYIGCWGIFIGGAVVGVIGGLLKLAGVI